MAPVIEVRPISEAAATPREYGGLGQASILNMLANLVNYDIIVDGERLSPAQEKYYREQLPFPGNEEQRDKLISAELQSYRNASRSHEKLQKWLEENPYIPGEDDLLRKL